ncbi:uncharacterized protein LOC113214730 isoform X2 [Frankliniella occidentalis]|uniref:Uncharacterized protein LOC113214730 isoform X2 n=1 Tax=Frankliniella occidentalis TaxID=133901 RepID=A0A6J1T9K6_FRAOC|nr:uncharacterized protein LOC113214730 isoform X2 [Frankliniella occidentalis]
MAPNCVLCEFPKSKLKCSLFRFPPAEKESTLRQSWLEYCGLTSEPRKSMYLCANHFRRSDMDNFSSKVCLKQRAVPSVPREEWMPLVPKRTIRTYDFIPGSPGWIEVQRRRRAIQLDLERSRTAFKEMVHKRYGLKMDSPPPPLAPLSTEPTEEAINSSGNTMSSAPPDVKLIPTLPIGDKINIEMGAQKKEPEVSQIAPSPHLSFWQRQLESSTHTPTESMGDIVKTEVCTNV